MTENEKPNRCPYCTKKMEEKAYRETKLYKTVLLNCPEHGEIRINVRGET